MAIEKGGRWTRSLTFKKYFASGFGITHAGNYIRLDFGDEKVQFGDKNTANVSECQIIMDKEGFNRFFNLLKSYKEVKLEKKKKKN